MCSWEGVLSPVFCQHLGHVSCSFSVLTTVSTQSWPWLEGQWGSCVPPRPSDTHTEYNVNHHAAWHVTLFLQVISEVSERRLLGDFSRFPRWSGSMLFSPHSALWASWASWANPLRWGCYSLFTRCFICLLKFLTQTNSFSCYQGQTCVCS